MEVLDVCSGTGSTTKAFVDRGHHVIRVDNNRKFKALHLDVRHLAKDPEAYLGDWKPDALVLEPPCQKFSTNGKVKSWLHLDKGEIPEPAKFFGKRFPIDKAAREAVALVVACLTLRKKLGTKLWWMENPQAGLQTLDFMGGEMEGEGLAYYEIRNGPINFLSGCDVVQRTTVTYCQYGDTRMKPTTLWGNFGSWLPRSRCYNGDKCHEEAKRGAMTGTRGLKTDTERGMVPYALSEEIAIACERDLGIAPRRIA